MNEFDYCSMEKIEAMTLELAKKIRTSKLEFDVIVGVLRGGVIPAVYLSDFLNNHDVRAVRLKSYVGINKTAKVEIIQPLNGGVKGKKVLLVDDIADTGNSLKAALEHVREKGAKQVKIACLHYKPWSKVKPDYYVEETQKWVIYPWMARETIDELVLKGKEKEKTGIPKEKVKELRKL